MTLLESWQSNILLICKFDLGTALDLIFFTLKLFLDLLQSNLRDKLIQYGTAFYCRFPCYVDGRNGLIFSRSTTSTCARSSSTWTTSSSSTPPGKETKSGLALICSKKIKAINWNHLWPNWLSGALHFFHQNFLFNFGFSGINGCWMGQHPLIGALRT